MNEDSAAYDQQLLAGGGVFITSRPLLGSGLRVEQNQTVAVPLRLPDAERPRDPLPVGRPMGRLHTLLVSGTVGRHPPVKDRRRTIEERTEAAVHRAAPLGAVAPDRRLYSRDVHFLDSRLVDVIALAAGVVFGQWMRVGF